MFVNLLPILVFVYRATIFVLNDILPIRSRTVDPKKYANPDPGSQNVTDLLSAGWSIQIYFVLIDLWIN